MLIGIDSCKNPGRVYHAYNDKSNVTHQFILNGLKHANRLMGHEAFKLDEWEVIGEYDEIAGRHHAFVAPLKDVIIENVNVLKGERIRIEESYKYSRDEILELWEGARFAENTIWSNERGDYGKHSIFTAPLCMIDKSTGLHLVSKPDVFFSTKPHEYAAQPVPSLNEWRGLWRAWDAVTRQMIPEDELLSKPINLRNACIFYLGHIPTFLDIHMARATNGKATDPAYFWQIFERGIDPDVDDPEKCHAHSEIPDSWPPLEEILAHQQKIREKVESLYASNLVGTNHHVARAMWLGFEHEAMHLETLLYMLVQSDRVLPPPGTTVPDFVALAKKSMATAVENKWFTIPEADISIGLDDPDSDQIVRRYFGWDNERPKRSVHVKSFRARARPITNGEYASYLTKTGLTTIPASWCEQQRLSDAAHAANKRDSVINGFHNDTGSTVDVTHGKYVKTVFGTVPLKYALDWPVVASYDEVAGCAQWMGGRIPTLEEARSIYSYVDASKNKELQALGNTIPAVNGYVQKAA